MLEPVFEFPSDLSSLRILERYAELQLHAIRQAIAKAAEAEAEQQRATTRRARTAAGWKVEAQRMMGDRRPWRVHHGDCGMGKGRACSQDDARQLLADGVEPCQFCRPEVTLRMPS